MISNGNAGGIVSDKKVPWALVETVPLNKHGVTLIEILVATAILTTLTAVGLTAFKLDETFRDMIFVRIQLYNNNRRAHDSLISELQMSKNSTVNITNNTSPIPDEIYFRLPLSSTMDANYSVKWGAISGASLYCDTYSIHYNISGRNLVREVVDSDFKPVSGTQEIRGSDVVDIQFSYPTASLDYIHINTTTNKVALPPQRPKQINDTLNSTVYLLN